MFILRGFPLAIYESIAGYIATAWEFRYRTKILIRSSCKWLNHQRRNKKKFSFLFREDLPVLPVDELFRDLSL